MCNVNKFYICSQDYVILLNVSSYCQDNFFGQMNGLYEVKIDLKLLQSFWQLHTLELVCPRLQASQIKVKCIDLATFMFGSQARRPSRSLHLWNKRSSGLSGRWWLQTHKAHFSNGQHFLLAGRHALDRSYVATELKGVAYVGTACAFTCCLNLVTQLPWENFEFFMLRGRFTLLPLPSFTH